MDPSFVERYWESLPKVAALCREGGFSRVALHGAVFTRPVRAHLGASHFGQYSVVPRLTNGPSLDLRRFTRRPWRRARLKNSRPRSLPSAEPRLEGDVP